LVQQVPCAGFASGVSEAMVSDLRRDRRQSRRKSCDVRGPTK